VCVHENCNSPAQHCCLTWICDGVSLGKKCQQLIRLTQNGGHFKEMKFEIMILSRFSIWIIFVYLQNWTSVRWVGRCLCSGRWSRWSVSRQTWLSGLRQSRNFADEWNLFRPSCKHLESWRDALYNVSWTLSFSRFWAKCSVWKNQKGTVHCATELVC